MAFEVGQRVEINRVRRSELGYFFNGGDTGTVKRVEGEPNKGYVLVRFDRVTRDAAPPPGVGLLSDEDRGRVWYVDVESLQLISEVASLFS